MCMHLFGLLEHLRLVCMCSMITSYVCHYSFGMIHVWHDFVCHVWISLLIRNDSCHTWFVCHVWISHVICVSLLIRNDSHMTNEHAHAPIWMSWTLATYLYVQHDWFICLTLLRLIHMCGTMCSCVQYDTRTCTCTLLDCLKTTFVCATWLIHMCYITTPDWFMCDMTHSCVQHDKRTCTCNLLNVLKTSHLFVRATWLIYVSNITPSGSYAWHMAWLINICNMTSAYANAPFRKRGFS